jgi:hypothetical protein
MQKERSDAILKFISEHTILNEVKYTGWDRIFGMANKTYIRAVRGFDMIPLRHIPIIENTLSIYGFKPIVKKD